jgi:RNA polymerase sigma-70 factor (ECF subfamily)
MADLKTDEQLLRAIAHSEHEALELLYTRYWQQLFMVAYNVLKNKSACEDIVQEAFLQIWQRRQKLDIQTSLEAYLFSMIRYSVFRYIKKEQAHSQVFENLEDRLHCITPEDIVVEKNIRSQLAVVVNSLPEKCREVYILSREEHLTHHEIANRLNISTKTVENQITIALKKIRFSITRMTGIFFFISFFSIDLGDQSFF